MPGRPRRVTAPRRAATALALALALVLALGACTGGAMRAAAPAAEGPWATRRDWVPEDGRPPRAVILALHGFNDYSQAFEAFGTYSAARGVAVHAYDHRGFGANPDAGRWAGLRALTRDLRREAARLRGRYPDTPLYILGESMGAAVLIAAVTGPAPPDADGFIFSAPAVWGGDSMPDLYRATLWVAERLTPWWQLTGKGVDIQASDNVEMLRALGADPLVIKATRVDAIAGLVRLMDRAVVEVEDVPGPLLLLTGAKDEVVPPEAFDAIRPRLNAQPCTAVDYPDGWHLLLRDLQREVVWADILAWIDGEPLPSGLAEPCGGVVAEVDEAPPPPSRS